LTTTRTREREAQRWLSRWWPLPDAGESL